MAEQSANMQRTDYKFVFQLRYDYGNTYLDRCGVTMNDILQSLPGWEKAGASPQQGTIRDREREITFNFNTLTLDLSQELSRNISSLVQIDEFAQIACDLSEKVTARLEVRDSVTRIGFRVWQLFGHYDTFDAAREALLAVALVRLDQFKSCGVDGVKEAGCSVIADRGTCWTRIAVAAVEQSVTLDPATLKKKLKSPIYKMPPDQRRTALIDHMKADKAIKSFPPFAILVDMDHYLEYPPYPDHLNIRDDFIVQNYGWSKETASKLIQQK